MTWETYGTWMKKTVFSIRCLQRKDVLCGLIFEFNFVGKKAKSGKSHFLQGKMKGKLVSQSWYGEAKRCFRLASVTNKLAEFSYFDDSKSWMQVKITEKLLNTLNFQMRKERRNVTLFLDNATVLWLHWLTCTAIKRLFSFQIIQRRVWSRLMLEPFKFSEQIVMRSWGIMLLHV